MNTNCVMIQHGYLKSKALVVFLSTELLPSLLSTRWFQEEIQVSFHNQTKIN